MNTILKFFSFIMCTTTALHLFSQNLVALHKQDTTLFYNGVNGFVSAYNNAANGDTIYLPGGFFSPAPTINKQLVIIGAGHYPDSTTATEKTILTGGFTISEDADNLHIHGLQINGTLTISNNHSVNNMYIRRCLINGNINYQGNFSNPCINNFIMQNVVNGWLYGTNAQNLTVANNIISGKITDMNTNIIQHNILLADFYTQNPYYSYAVLINANNSTIKNNVFFSTDVNCISGTSNYVKNNIFRMNWNEGNNIASNNYKNIDITTVFVNQTGNSFNYQHDYHLQSPATYPADDNTTEVGIYGGIWGYKEGAVPMNPHIQISNIAPTTNTNGELNIQIQVEAQDE